MKIKFRTNILLITTWVTFCFFILLNLTSIFIYFSLARYVRRINPNILGLLDTLNYFVIGMLIYLAYKFYPDSKLLFKKVSSIGILKVILIAILFSLSIDPLLNINILLGFSDYPAILGSSDNYLTLINVINYLILIPIIEEIVFRNFILRKLFETKGALFSVIYSTFLFSLVHINFLNFDSALYFGSILSGLLFGIIYIEYGLYGSIISHVIINFLWLFLANFNNLYWDTIKTLNFGIYYWLIILFAIVALGVLIKPFNDASDLRE